MRILKQISSNIGIIQNHYEITVYELFDNLALSIAYRC